MPKHRPHVRMDWDAENGAIITIIGHNRMWPEDRRKAVEEFLKTMQRLSSPDDIITTSDYAHHQIKEE